MEQSLLSPHSLIGQQKVEWIWKVLFHWTLHVNNKFLITITNFLTGKIIGQMISYTCLCQCHQMTHGKGWSKICSRPKKFFELFEWPLKLRLLKKQPFFVTFMFKMFKSCINKKVKVRYGWLLYYYKFVIMYCIDPLQERMIQKGFQITKIESVMQNVFAAAAAASTGSMKTLSQMYKYTCKTNNLQYTIYNL